MHARVSKDVKDARGALVFDIIRENRAIVRRYRRHDIWEKKSTTCEAWRRGALPFVVGRGDCGACAMDVRRQSWRRLRFSHLPTL